MQCKTLQPPVNPGLYSTNSIKIPSDLDTITMPLAADIQALPDSLGWRPHKYIESAAILIAMGLVLGPYLLRTSHGLVLT